ncbi:MAG: DUF2066 domain-containing protein [Gammaproteobacteria bacterium]
MSNCKTQLRIRVIALFTLLMSSVMPGLLSAAEVEGLYEAEIQVVGQGKAEQGEAIRAALAEVLMKVTGRRGVAALPTLAPMFKRADKVAQQYRYRPLTEDMARIIPVAPSAVQPPGKPVAAKGQVLWVSFDSATVNQALRQAGLPVWGRVRPATLILLAMEGQDQRTVLLGDSRPELQSIMENRARRRGLPVLLPQDAEAEGGVRFADVWSNARDALLKAAARGQTEAVLAGRLSLRSGTWRVRWTFYQGGGEAVNWESVASAPQDVLEAGIDGAADELAKRFAQVLSDAAATSVLMTVTNITTLDDYARTMNYLQSLAGVTEAAVVRVKADSVTFRVLTRSSDSGLAQSIALGSILSVANSDPAASELKYILLP